MASIILSNKRADTRQAFTELKEGLLSISSLQLNRKEIEISNIIKMIELGAVMQVLNSLTDILSRKIRKSSVRVEDRMLRMDQYAVIEKCKTNGIVALAVH